MDEDQLLQRACDGDEDALLQLLTGRMPAAEVDQALLGRAASGEAAALARLYDLYLAGLGVATSRFLDGGRLHAACIHLDQDLALLHRWVAGNKGSAKALIARYYPILDRFVRSKVRRSEEAEDIVQEVFQDVAKQYRQIRVFRPFVFKLAINKTRGWFRDKYKKPVDTGATGISQLAQDTGHGVEAMAEDRRERKLLLIAMHHLSLDDQMIVELYTWEDFTAPQIAEIFGLKVHDVRHLLRRAKQAMRDFLLREGDQLGYKFRTADVDEFFADLQDDAHTRAEHGPID